MTRKREQRQQQRRDERRIDSHLAQLAEHFETVQIFVTRHNGESGETTYAARGVGNYFARLGQTKGWVASQIRQS